MNVKEEVKEVEEEVKFYITPIENERFLFGRKEELEKFRKFLKDTPIIAVLGPRRCGKTSFIKVLASTSEYPNIYLDLRQYFGSAFSTDSVKKLIHALEDGLNELKERNEGKDNRKYNPVELMKNLPKYISKYIEEVPKYIEEVGVLGNKIKFKDIPLEESDLYEIFSGLNKWAEDNKTLLVIFIDEAGYLKDDTVSYSELLAWIHDNAKNIRIVLTGSEIQLIMDLLKWENKYGKIVLKAFSEEKAREFLEKGLSNELTTKKEMINDEINRVIPLLGGIPGWLSQYGYYRCSGGFGSEEALRKVRNDAEKYVKDELKNFIKFCQENLKIHEIKVLMILEYIGREWKKEDQVREYLEKRLNLNRRDISKMLDKLGLFSFLEKNANGQIRLVDPMHYEFIPEVLDDTLGSM